MFLNNNDHSATSSFHKHLGFHLTLSFVWKICFSHPKTLFMRISGATVAGSGLFSIMKCWRFKSVLFKQPISDLKCRGITSGVHLDGTSRRQQRQPPPAEIISIVRRRTKAGAKTPTFLHPPISEEPPYHTQMFPIKGTHNPLHPEDVNHEKDTLKQRVSELLLTACSFFSEGHNFSAV